MTPAMTSLALAFTVLGLFGVLETVGEERKQERLRQTRTFDNSGECFEFYR